MKKRPSKRTHTIHRLMLGMSAAGALAALGCGAGPGSSMNSAPLGTHCNSNLSSNTCMNNNVGQVCCVQYNGNDCISNGTCLGPYENDTVPDQNHTVRAVCGCGK